MYTKKILELNLLNKHQVNSYKRNQYLIKNNIKLQGIFIILKGSVDYIIETKKSAFFLQRRNGQFTVGLDLLFSKNTPQYSVVCNEDVEYIFIDKKNMSTIYKIPNIYEDLLLETTRMNELYLELIKNKINDDKNNLIRRVKQVNKIGAISLEDAIYVSGLTRYKIEKCLEKERVSPFL